MKKIKYLIFTLFTFFLFLNVNALELNITSKTAILYNLDSGEVLYQKNENEKVSIASLTKIMTAIVTLDKIQNLDERVVITSSDIQGLAAANAVTAGFTVGEVVTYRDLLYGLLLPSGADAAQALARNVAGSIPDFINLMNEKSQELNLENTHFSTVIGLDDEDNYSTAKAVATMFKYALENQTFKEIIKTSKYTTSDSKITMYSSTLNNAKKYDADYILGGKTGTTTDAGLCLASIASQNDVNYLLVTTGALYDKKEPHHILDAKTIYDYFINNYGNQTVVSTNDIVLTLKTEYTTKENYDIYSSKDIVTYLPNDYNSNDINYKYEGIDTITPFMKENTKLGTLKIYYQDELLDTQNIYLTSSVPFSLSIFLSNNWYLIVLPIIIILLLIIFIFRKRKRNLKQN